MGTEQERPISDAFDRIDPKKLVEQEGPNKGRISPELIPGKVVEIQEGSTQKIGDEVQVVDGLPRTGAEGEDFSRGLEGLESSERRKGIPGRANMVGTAAMAGEVAKRAADITPFGATPETKEKIKDNTRASFLTEVEDRAMEKQADDEAAAQELLKKIQGSNNPEKE